MTKGHCTRHGLSRHRGRAFGRRCSRAHSAGKKWTKRTLLQFVLGTLSIEEQLCTRLDRRQVEKLSRLPLSGRGSCGGLEPSAAHTHSTGLEVRLTQVEVVVLRIADNEEDDDGVDDG